MVRSCSDSCSITIVKKQLSTRPLVIIKPTNRGGLWREFETTTYEYALYEGGSPGSTASNFLLHACTPMKPPADTTKLFIDRSRGAD